MRFGHNEAGERRIFLILLLITLGTSLAAVLVFDRASANNSLLDLTNLVGPTVASLLAGRGMTACTVLMGTPGNPICFHGGRMPVPSLVVAAAVRLVGDRFLPVAVLKTLLLLAPLEAAMDLVCRQMRFAGRRWVWMAVLLLLPFWMTAFLADVVNLQVEEGYSTLAGAGDGVVLFRAGTGGAERWGGEAAVLGAALRVCTWRRAQWRRRRRC